MRKTLAFYAAFCALVLLPAGDALAAGAGHVVVSIRPLHSLVQGVMGDTGEAALLLAGDASLHGFSFRPSQIRMLHEADVVFYIDDALESFLRNAAASLPARVRKSAVAREAGLTILDQRKGGAWEAHAHHAGEHEEEPHHGHGHERGARRNLHVWLDPDNAKKIAEAVARTLGDIAPANRGVYERNARALTARLDALDARLKQTLAGVRDKPFIVFHDAYRYFEQRYGLTAVGAITAAPDEAPSVQRIKQIREKIRAAGAVCVFREPQFPDKLINTVTQGGSIRSGTLDPLGFGLKPGPDLYFQLLKNLAKDFRRCLD